MAEENHAIIDPVMLPPRLAALHHEREIARLLRQLAEAERIIAALREEAANPTEKAA